MKKIEGYVVVGIDLGAGDETVLTVVHPTDGKAEREVCVYPPVPRVCSTCSRTIHSKYIKIETRDVHNIVICCSSCGRETVLEPVIKREPVHNLLATPTKPRGADIVKGTIDFSQYTRGTAKKEVGYSMGKRAFEKRFGIQDMRRKKKND